MIAPYFTILPGRLNVTATGAKVLQEYTGRPKNTWYASGMKSGSETRLNLQRQIADLQTQCSFPGVGSTNHHIYSGARISKILSGALDKPDSLQVLNDYINSRTGIYNQLLTQVNLGETKQALSDVYVSVYWNQYNLVLGPDKRSLDPGSQMDKEVLALQTDQVKTQYDYIDQAFNAKNFSEALRILLLQRTLYNGTWHQGIDDKWKLSASVPPRTKIGTAGFAYRFWPWP